MWARIMLRVCAIIIVITGVLIILSAYYPDMWANVSWDMNVCGLGVAISAIGLCFISLSR